MNLKEKLDYHYKNFDNSKINPDPLQFLHLFSDERDIEVVGFLASIFAYGNVRQIDNTLKKIVAMFDGKPFLFVKNFLIKNNSSDFRSLKHRFYTADDIVKLFIVFAKEINQFGSIKNIFLKGYTKSDRNIKEGLSNFSIHFLESFHESFGKISRGIKFMFPLPKKNSACKRMNLFLRWMVRKDELDFGLWNEIPTNKLIIPVDTHVARICMRLNLTARKNVSWKMAEEITNNLRKYDQVDPVKYDFAICHIGIRKLKF